jgi:hypothetical protein
MGLRMDMTPEQRTLANSLYAAASDFIASFGWRFGGDQTGFTWEDPITQNWHDCITAAFIQCDRNAVETARKLT